MTTALSTAIVVDANGLIAACSWCCTRAQLVALHRAYPAKVSHGACPSCAAKLMAELDTLDAA